MRHVDMVEPPDVYFDDFTEGQEFPVVTKGPMMVGHQVRWAGATDNYDGEFHHDEYVAKAQGHPGIILSGPMVAAYTMSAIGQWVGRNARLTKFTDRFSGSMMPRDVLTLHGTVKRKYDEGRRHLLDLDCYVENQRGEKTAAITATVALAARADLAS